MGELLNKLKNIGTLTSVTSLILLIAATNGIEVDNERVMTTIKAICSIGLILGILNNPNTPGLDNPIEKKENSSL